jgi:hypothetical protein
MKGSNAGQNLDPRPSTAIASFCGRRIEITLRILAPLLGSVPALAAAAVVLITTRNHDGYTESDDNIYAVTGVVITVACVGIMIEFMMNVLHFLNIRQIHRRIHVFLVIDILISFALAGGHSVGGSAVLQEYFGDEDLGLTSGSHIDIIKRALIASAVFSFVAVFLYIHLGILMIFNMINNWNSYIVKAASEAARVGNTKDTCSDHEAMGIEYPRRWL